MALRKAKIINQIVDKVSFHPDNKQQKISHRLRDTQYTVCSRILLAKKFVVLVKLLIRHDSINPTNSGKTSNYILSNCLFTSKQTPSTSLT